jgi:hypothetical protein
MPRALSIFFAWAFLLCGFVAFGHAQQAATPSLRGVIKVARVMGDVNVTDLATSLKTRVTTSTLITEGQVVETGPNSSVVLVLSNGAVVNVRADARLEITQFLQNPFSSTFKVGQATSEPSTSATKLTLRKGEIISQVKKLNREAGSSFTVETPVGAAGIRGTAFRLGYTTSGSTARYMLSMAEGLIQFIPLRGRGVEVAAGREVSFVAQIDPNTGAVINLPATFAPGEVSGADLASLQSFLADALAAAMNVDFAPAGANGQFSVGAAATGETAPVATAAPSPDAGADAGATGPIASPPATTPPLRTTGGDGVDGG